MTTTDTHRISAIQTELAILKARLARLVATYVAQNPQESYRQIMARFHLNAEYLCAVTKKYGTARGANKQTT
jgi:hypothetical protein